MAGKHEKSAAEVARAALKVDGGNRAVRAALQSAGLEILIVVIPKLYEALGDQAWNPSWDWAESLARVAGMALASYVMRVYLDPSRVPTPLPPAPVPAPADPEGGVL